MAPLPNEGPFAVPRRVGALMAGFSRPWYLAGGWALDVWLGRVTRPHEDVEIAILRDDQEEIRRHLDGWEFDKVAHEVGGPRRERWREGERLELSVHEIHARRRGGDPRELEILLNEADGGRWTFRRDPRVFRPMDEAGTVVAGIPVLAPEIVLLYKAKAARPRDEEDFRNALGHLTPEGQRWLLAALETAHPGHRWIPRL
ncbi:MAG: hypothetical protein E6K16_02990 [Methanobacteriota archaeon]|nr:MAG: hypothetical protein E6K16_02990 [Euryarchaeota archaeon]